MSIGRQPALALRKNIPEPSVTLARSLGVFGWGGFCHNLANKGAIESPIAPVPDAWREAFQTAFPPRQPRRASTSLNLS